MPHIPNHSDMDECAETADTLCGSNEVCVDTVGNFTCSCREGYERDDQQQCRSMLRERKHEKSSVSTLFPCRASGLSSCGLRGGDWCAVSGCTDAAGDGSAGLQEGEDSAQSTLPLVN